MTERCDFLVLGSGVAGLTFALEAAAHGEVVVVTKRAADESNTNYAQGGIAAVLSETDSFEAHVRDTLTAGAGLCHPRAVELTVEAAPARIQALVEVGARFDREHPSEAPKAAVAGEAGFDLHLEGGHSARRIVHTHDMTGREVQRALLEAVRRNPKIRLFEDHMAVDLITLAKFGGPEVCAGAYVLDCTSGKVETLLAHATVLATGGAGKVYLYTTNPDVATGDGVAMAYRAGAEIRNMEFYQFHPTCLYHPHAKGFLISEALRGEGAILRRLDGTAFMKDHDAREELAPRDVVARAIDFEMKKTGADHVLLDITHKPEAFVRERFPGIHAECLRYGIDIAKEPIPVVPAAHYLCGGVTTDLDGRTTIPGLWAIGECACTGLHGANRLASNSLLEGLVFAHRAAEALAGEARDAPFPDVPDWDVGQAGPSDEAVVVSQNWDELRRLMWNYVGIVRSTTRLRRAGRPAPPGGIAEYYWEHFVSAICGAPEHRRWPSSSSTAARGGSRGLHFTTDHPEMDTTRAGHGVARRAGAPLAADARPRAVGVGDRPGRR